MFVGELRLVQAGRMELHQLVERVGRAQRLAIVLRLGPQLDLAHAILADHRPCDGGRGRVNPREVPRHARRLLDALLLVADLDPRPR